MPGRPRGSYRVDVVVLELVADLAQLAADLRLDAGTRGAGTRGYLLILLLLLLLLALSLSLSPVLHGISVSVAWRGKHTNEESVAQSTFTSLGL